MQKQMINILPNRLAKNTKRSQVFRFLVKKPPKQEIGLLKEYQFPKMISKLSTTAFGVESRKAQKTARDSFNHNL